MPVSVIKSPEPYQSRSDDNNTATDKRDKCKLYHNIPDHTLPFFHRPPTFTTDQIKTDRPLHC